MKQNRSIKIIFLLLVLYVLFQFFWWSYLIYELNNEVVFLKQKLAVAQNNVTPDYSKLLEKKLSMIIGEGSVFLILLGVGIYQIYRSIVKQEKLAWQQHNFMLSVTHELKTPLASTRLQLETLLKRELSTEKREKILINALADTDRLTHLIENILIASRADGYNFNPQPEEVKIFEVLQNLINHSNIFANQKDRIEINSPENIYLLTDKFAFSTIMINLIENALKYSTDKVFINIQNLNQTVVIEVADCGEGIKENERQLIFNKFYRSGSEETRRTRGTGLGLYIVKFLVESLKGKISVYSNKPKGSVFRVEFNK